MKITTFLIIIFSIIWLYIYIRIYIYMEKYPERYSKSALSSQAYATFGIFLISIILILASLD